MDNTIIISEIIFDSLMMYLCCEGMFRSSETKKRRDLILIPIIFLFFMMLRFSVSADTPAGTIFMFEPKGYEIAPANNLFILLFMIMILLFINSVYYRPMDTWAICGTMGAFSIYLAARTLGLAVFSFDTANKIMIEFANRLLSLSFVTFMYYTTFFERLRLILNNGGLSAIIVSSNITVILSTVLSYFSFDILLIKENLFVVSGILFLLLVFDSVLLYYNYSKLQDQKHLHMLEQYIPIIEEVISHIRSRQHEFQNQLLAIDAAVHSADTLEEAQKNVSALTAGITLAPNDRNLLICDSKIITGMLYGKIQQAKLANINISLTIEALFKKCKTSETDWIEVIGILLDNAIEAVSSGDTIYVKARQIDMRLEFTVSNPAASMSNLEFIHLFNKGVTSKKNISHHGFGLYNILRLSERLHGKILTYNEEIASENYVVFGVLLP